MVILMGVIIIDNAALKTLLWIGTASFLCIIGNLLVSHTGGGLALTGLVTCSSL